MNLTLKISDSIQVSDSDIKLKEIKIKAAGKRSHDGNATFCVLFVFIYHATHASTNKHD